MIRTLNFKCCECGKEFQPGKTVYYKDDYCNHLIQNTEFICDDCIQAWREKWQIKAATFHDKDCVMTVDLTLKDGTKLKDVDCTPLEENETVVLGEDVPVEAQKKLYKIFMKWDQKRKANVLKYCHFDEEFMRTTVTCETFSGEKFEKVAFRINRRGELETEVEMPDYIKEQIIDAFSMYEMQAELETMPHEEKTDD